MSIKMSKYLDRIILLFDLYLSQNDIYYLHRKHKIQFIYDVRHVHFIYQLINKYNNNIFYT